MPTTPSDKCAKESTSTKKENGQGNQTNQMNTSLMVAPTTYPELVSTYTPSSIAYLLTLFSKQDSHKEAESVRAWVILQIIFQRVYTNYVSLADNKVLKEFLNKKNVSADEACLQVMILLKPWKSWAEFYRQGASYYGHWITSKVFRSIVAKFEVASRSSPLAQSMKALAIFMDYHWDTRHSYPWWRPSDVHHYRQIAKNKSLPHLPLEKPRAQNVPAVVIAKCMIWKEAHFYDEKKICGIKRRIEHYQQFWIAISEVVRKYDLPEAHLAQAQLLSKKPLGCTSYNFLDGYRSPMKFLEQYAKDTDPSNPSFAWYARFYRMLQSYIEKNQDDGSLIQWYLMLAEFLNDDYSMCVSEQDYLHMPELKTPFDAVYECAWSLRRSMELLAENHSRLPTLTGYKKQDFEEEIAAYKKVNFNSWDFKKGEQIGNVIYQYHTNVATRSFQKVQFLLKKHTSTVAKCILKRDKDAILQQDSPFHFRYIKCTDVNKEINRLKEQHAIPPYTFILLHDGSSKKPYTVCARGIHHDIVTARVDSTSFPKTHQFINSLTKKTADAMFKNLKVQNKIKASLADDLGYLKPLGLFLRTVIEAVAQIPHHHHHRDMLALYLLMAQYFEASKNLPRATTWCGKVWHLLKSSDGNDIKKTDWAFLGDVYSHYKDNKDYIKRAEMCSAHCSMFPPQPQQVASRQSDIFEAKESYSPS